MSQSNLVLFVIIFQLSLIKSYIFELWSTEQLDDMIMSDAFKKVNIENSDNYNSSIHND